MNYKNRRAIATVAALAVVAVTNQKTNCVHCFTLSKSTFTPRLQPFTSNSKNMNTRQGKLFYRINGDNNQTEHETSSSTRNTNTDLIVENLNHQKTPNTPLDIIKEDEIDNKSENEIANINNKRDYAGAGTLGDIMSDPSQDNDNVDNADAVISEDRDYSSSVNSTTAVDVSTPFVKAHPNRERKLEAKHESNSDTKTKPTKSGLVTSTGGTLSSQFGQKVPNLSPLDRIALTANGNLQRIFSSFYDAPVHVHVEQCVKRATGGDPSILVNGGVLENAVWDRVVHLSVFEQVSYMYTMCSCRLSFLQCDIFTCVIAEIHISNMA